MRAVWSGLALIAAARAVLTFTSVQNLSVLCGYGPWVAWLLPVTTEVTAATATAVWLGPGADREAVVFARRLAWGSLGLSIGANGLEHGLTAYGALPEWWVVVGVSAVPPVMLGAVVHLAVLTGRPGIGHGQDRPPDRSADAAGVPDGTLTARPAP